MSKLTYNKIFQTSIAKELTQIIFGIILLFACSQVSIPLKPVPISLQTVGLMLIAFLYDEKTGMRTILGYLGAGIIGIPVFAEYSSGIGVFMRGTGGYLIGFAGCVYTMNKLKSYLNQNTVYGIFVNCLCGTVVIFACGIAWLTHLIGFMPAIHAGLLPFIIPGIDKALMLTFILRSVGVLKGRWKGQ